MQKISIKEHRIISSKSVLFSIYLQINRLVGKLVVFSLWPFNRPNEIKRVLQLLLRLHNCLVYLHNFELYFMVPFCAKHSHQKELKNYFPIWYEVNSLLESLSCFVFLRQWNVKFILFTIATACFNIIMRFSDKQIDIHRSFVNRFHDYFWCVFSWLWFQELFCLNCCVH